jgi:hypothetical protein
MARSASSSDTLGGRVTSRARGVMKSETGRASEPASRGMSRCERMPASLPLPFTSSMRKLLALNLRMSWRASAMVAVRSRRSGWSMTWEWRVFT